MRRLAERNGRRPRKSVVLLLTHRFDDAVAAEYSRLRAECEPRYDVRLLYDRSWTYPGREIVSIPGAVGFVGDEMTSLIRRNQGRTLPMGKMDLPAIAFYLEHPQYDHYWIVEYDVRFSGPWTELFDAFVDRDVDLLATTVRRYPDTPDWHWWPDLWAPDGELREEERISAFFPVYRVSNRGLYELQRQYRRGWRGHYECTLPTILHRKGYRIEDMGGEGEFVAAGNENRFYVNTPEASDYSPGTFVYRPVKRSPGSRPLTLWHPVTSDGADEEAATAQAGRVNGDPRLGQ